MLLFVFQKTFQKVFFVLKVAKPTLKGNSSDYPHVVVLSINPNSTAFIREMQGATISMAAVSNWFRLLVWSAISGEGTREAPPPMNCLLPSASPHITSLVFHPYTLQNSPSLLFSLFPYFSS